MIEVHRAALERVDGPLPTGLARLATAIDDPAGTFEYPTPGLHLTARSGEGMDDGQWLAIADDTWRRARAEANPFRRHALLEETAGADPGERRGDEAVVVVVDGRHA